MNQSPQGFDEAKEKAAKEHAEEFAVPYGDHGYKIAFESYHTGADFGYEDGFKASQEQIDKLQAFKDFIHRRLDEMAIPTHPDGEHSKAGCRIGDRLDIVQNLLELPTSLKQQWYVEHGTPQAKLSEAECLSLIEKLKEGMHRQARPADAEAQSLKSITMNNKQKAEEYAAKDTEFNTLLEGKSREYAEGFRDALKFMIDMDDLYGDTIQLEAAISEAMNRGIKKGLEIALSASSGVQLIAQERDRQIGVEGWTAEHDAQYNLNELRRAAVCYITADLYKTCAPPTWPFAQSRWKPDLENHVHNLQKAGALIAAEIDRIQTTNPSNK